MTRRFNQTIECPHCGTVFPAETAFCRWMRNCPELDSQAEGVLRTDMDYIIHRCKTHEQGRDFQLQMVIEVKTNMAQPSASQEDTLSCMSQLIRTRSPNMHHNPKRQVKCGIIRVKSFKNQNMVRFRHYGIHCLQFSGTNPEDSDLILWDYSKQITKEQLIGLLRLDLDPDTLKPVDLRDHHKKRQMDLPLAAS